MRVVLARHDEILRQAIESSDGFIFKTMGDAFFASFADPVRALEAAERAQLAISKEPWPVSCVIKIRLVLHAGAAEFRAGDYFGQALNRSARVLSVVHGGQSLMTQAVKELLQDEMPLHVGITSLGEHRLKDLGQPERLWQIDFVGSPVKFPELRSLNGLQIRNNLPLQMTTFIGRDKELEDIEQLLRKSRILTLLGAGGCGKSRLAVQVAASVAEEYEDGVWLVELAPVSNPNQLVTSIGAVFGLKDEASKPMVDVICEYLESKRLVILLDNCEHLLDTAATVTQAVLLRCPHVSVLATSREPLGATGERTYRVPSLSIPESTSFIGIDEVAKHDAVRLFVERTEMHQSQFALSSSNAPAVASICRRLDGIPLAIELAAARMRSLTAEEIDARLDHRFGLLTGGSRTAMPRQQTLRALIDWSYELLSHEEKLMLKRASVFAGGWTLRAAEAVCAGGDLESWQILDLLISLVDKSLVSTEEVEGQTRYKLLETVRQYGRELLEHSGEAEMVRQNHSDAYLAMAEEAESHLQSFDQLLWIARLEKEHENLRTGWEWILQTKNGKNALRLCKALFIWWRMGYLVEGREWSAQALNLGNGNEDDLALKARTYCVAGYLAWKQGDYAEAFHYFQQGYNLALQTGDNRSLYDAYQGFSMAHFGVDDYAAAKVEILKCLEIADRLDEVYKGRPFQVLGILLRIEGDMPAAFASLRKSIDVYRACGDRIGMSYPLYDLGLALYYNGDFESALVSFEESLAIRQETNERWGMAESLYGLGLVYSALNFPEKAQDSFADSANIAAQISDSGRRALCLVGMSYLDIASKNVLGAEAKAMESLRLFEELTDRWGTAKSLDAIALVKCSLGHYDFAAQLWGSADGIRNSIASPLPPSERAMKDRRAEAARKFVGDEKFLTCYEEGMSADVDGILARLDLH